MATCGRFERYLERRAELGRRPLVGGNLEGIEQVVVIPAYAESASLPQTLQSLVANPAGERARTLVLCVVNNRAGCTADVRADNAATLAELEDWRTRGGAPLRVAYVDAASAGSELGAKEGVGVARKIGMDWAVEVLRQSNVVPRLIVSLDADTLVEPNYLEALRGAFGAPDAWAAVVAYAHPLEGAEVERAAILAYETHLRCHALGLRYAASPYAFHTIGSAMACTAEAYVAAGGMNRRQAGEDFYFLQEIRKTGGVECISTTTVHPSARASHRVPFGTGRRMAECATAGTTPSKTYHPHSYDVLRAWLRGVEQRLEATGAELLQLATDIEPELSKYLRAKEFEWGWDRLCENAPDKVQRLAQFHRWFDAFRTLKLLHHLRDHGYPDQPLYEAVAGLLARLEQNPGMPVSSITPEDYAAQTKVLWFLRQLDRER